jgi:very-short-patch-repair endonuclease
MSTIAASSRALLRLDRHQRARDEDIPTISVIVGDITAAHAWWTQWLESRERPALWIVLGDDPAPVARMLAAAILRGRDVVHDVAVLLAPHVREPPAELERRLRAQGTPERAAFFEHVSSPSLPSRVGELACSLLTASGDPLDRLPDVDTMVTFLQLLAPSQRPGLAIAGPRIDRALPTLQAIAERLPQLPVALAVESNELQRFLTVPAAARDHAMVRDGLVRLDEPERAPERPGSSPGVEELREQLAELCRLALDDADAAERARSLAERLLFEALEGHPATRGRFELNAQMPFCFGPRPAEIDMVSRRDHIAIEIDGYYHFVDADAYRRDRRKDVLLQRNGLFVLRFLAQDVGPSLDQIIDRIVDVLHRPRPPGASA